MPMLDNVSLTHYALVVQPTWTVRPADPSAIDHLTKTLQVRPITARCLAARGISEAQEARSYLQPRLGHLRRPDGLSGLDVAVARIRQAVVSRQRIGVFGDYDVDGITTAALITSFLQELGASVVSRVARRDAGYGFGYADADYFASAGCQLVITGDCGTSDIDAIERAKARCVDVIVVDHHTVPAGNLTHPALALVNPFCPDSTFPFRNMASVGLSFYLIAALRTTLRDEGYFTRRTEPDVRSFLDLVALGTVADLVPLRGENRILTAAGLRLLARRRRPGIAALMKIAAVDLGRPIDERTIGWKLGPRLNAPGRMGDASPALSLLMAADEPTAWRWAEELELANKARQEIQSSVFEQVTSTLGDRDPGPAVVIAGEGWPSGVAGIVAAKLVERYQRPAFVIAIDPASGIGRGSARTVPGVDLYRSLERCADLLDRYGGHSQAAGLTVRASRISELREALWNAVEQNQRELRTSEVAVDAEVALGEVDERLCAELGYFAPFGNGNEEPLLMCRGMRVRQSRRVGDGSHLKLEVEDRHGVARSGIAFGLGDFDPGAGATIAAAFAPTVSLWGGLRRVELEIRKLSAGSASC